MRSTKPSNIKYYAVLALSVQDGWSTNHEMFMRKIDLSLYAAICNGCEDKLLTMWKNRPVAPKPVPVVVKEVKETPPVAPVAASKPPAGAREPEQLITQKPTRMGALNASIGSFSKYVAI